MTPQAWTEIQGRKIPDRLGVLRLPAAGSRSTPSPLNANAWMGTSFPYWEGPIRFTGSHAGLGYLEMTGY